MMKILCNIFLILAVVQIFAVVNSNPVSPNNETEKFLEYFEKELNIMAEELCENFKSTSELLLNYTDFNNPNAGYDIKELKLFMEEFLRDYPHIKRYRNYEFVLLLIRIIRKQNYYNYYDDMKFNKLFHQCFHTTIQKYSITYEKFIEEKLLPQLEDIRKKLQNEKKQSPIYEKLIENLKNCHSFDCLPESSNIFVAALSLSKETAIKYTLKDYKKMLNLMYILTYNRSKLLLKDPQLTQLSSELKTNLTLDLQESMRLFENNNDTEKFVLAVKDHLDLAKKYFNTTNFQAKDQEILNEIFQKYSKISRDKSRYEKAFSNIMEHWSISFVLFLVYDPDAISKEYHHLLEYKGFLN